jgi:Nif-specific regulatory protein
MYQQGRYVLTRLSTDVELKVNNKLICDQHTFMHGDILTIGPWECTFQAFFTPDSSVSIVPESKTPAVESSAPPLHELIGAIVSLLKNRDKDVFTDLVTSLSRLLKSDAARLVFDDILSNTRQTVARYPQESGLDRFSNRAIDWAKNGLQTILASDDHWEDPSQSITKNRVSSILCAPLRENDIVIGFLYLDRLQNKDPFTEDDRTLCDSLIPLFSEILSYHSERQQQQATIDRFQRQQLIQSDGLIYSCQSMQAIVDLTARYARTDSPVLILGETGTGKELLARMLHQKSSRSGKPFKAINCGAIPETLIESELFGYEKGAFTGANSRKIGLLEASDGGSIFLDEIAELPIQMQVKLLRALQESEISRLGSHDTIKIDIRIIAATNRNLEIEVSANKFRQDLYFRLNVLTLKLPPLREREKDILLLADYFNSKYCQQFGVQLKTITLSAQNRLTTYNWPGNVRELENIIQKAILHTSDNKITSEQIDIAAPAVIKTLKEARAGAERELIHLTLKKTSGNISLSAKLLDIDRKWLMKIMEDLGIIIDDYRK